MRKLKNLSRCDQCFAKIRDHQQRVNCVECQGLEHTSKDFVPDYNDWVWKNEMKIRQKVSEVFNLGREDYPSDHEYNEFLEEREELSKIQNP
jgi:hypothetical protein